MLHKIISWGVVLNHTRSLAYTHLDESHFWCFHIIQDFYKIICDPPLTIKSYAGDFEQWRGGGQNN